MNDQAQAVLLGKLEERMAAFERKLGDVADEVKLVLRKLDSGCTYGRATHELVTDLRDVIHGEGGIDDRVTLLERFREQGLGRWGALVVVGVVVSQLVSWGLSVWALLGR